MGMLVDNAIVVTDNAQIAIKRGIRRRQALIDGATTPQWGLLGATMIAVFSFCLYIWQSSRSGNDQTFVYCVGRFFVT